jgi:glucose-6-phosphate 1-epimerase
MPISAEELNARHGLDGLAQIVAGNGGLTKVSVTAPAASGEIYLYGAHLTSWRPSGAEEAIFLSEKTHWQPGQAIRGGIPICSPWFRAKRDDPQAPKHGLVRTKEWQLQEVKPEGAGVAVRLTTQNDASGHKWWPHEFRLDYRVTFGAELRLELSTMNTGSTPFELEEALHIYHLVGEVQQIAVAGLDGVRYLDNTDGNREQRQQGEMSFTRETDSAYLNSAGSAVIVDPALRRRIRIEKTGSQSTVVWNPWQQAAHAMADLGDEEWHRFACVEPSNVLDCAVPLAPGQSHTIAATLQLESL